MPRARATSASLALRFSLSTTGIAICRPPARRPGASRPTCRNRPIGTIRATSSPGDRTCRRRTPAAHFFVEARYNGTKGVGITPDYSEVAKLSDLWLHPKQGTDGAFAMAMGHVILREFFLDRQVPYFQDYCRRYSDMPMLVRLRREHDRYVPD